jgi:hypothetical protein
VRRNGNLVSELIGDLRNRRNAAPNPVHRQWVNFLSLQQEAQCVTMVRGVRRVSRQFVSQHMSLLAIRPSRVARSDENKTESDSRIASRAKLLRATRDQKIFLE